MMALSPAEVAQARQKAQEARERLDRAIEEGKARLQAKHDARTAAREAFFAKREAQAADPSAPLDTLASKVSLSDEEAAQKVIPGPWKLKRHHLRRAAGATVGGRVSKCGVATLGGPVDIRKAEGHHHFHGLETCGSVWTCPVCAVRITEGRRSDIKTVIAGHLATEGKRAYMATFTIPHHTFQRLRELLDVVRGSWKRVKQGKAWVDQRDAYAWEGDIRALEVTHGGNGWHPHLHVVGLFGKGVSDDDIRAFFEWLFSRWTDAVEKTADKMGFSLAGKCSRAAFDFVEIRDEAGVSEYVSKWGAAEELTKAHTKSAKKGRTPWQILADIAEHDREEDKALFREYAAAFFRARQLTWSKGLRARFIQEPEKTDEELAAEPGLTPEELEEQRVVTIDKRVWKQVTKRGLTGELLQAADVEGLPGIIGFFAAYRIQVQVMDRPGRAPIINPPPWLFEAVEPGEDAQV